MFGTIKKAVQRHPTGGREAAKEALGIAAISVSIGYGVPAAAGYYARTSGARLALSYYRAPVLTLLANHARSGTVRWAARASLGVSRTARYAGYAASIVNPFMTYKYLRREDYTRAAISYYGPPGTVWVYNRALGIFEKSSRQPYATRDMPSSRKVDGWNPKELSDPRDKFPARTKVVKKSKKMSKVQRNRLWRMGLRWCPRHKRYDKCSLRAR